MALAVEIELDRESGRVRLKRAVAAVDSGEAVNPDGIKNHIEGGSALVKVMILGGEATTHAAKPYAETLRRPPSIK